MAKLLIINMLLPYSGAQVKRRKVIVYVGEKP